MKRCNNCGWFNVDSAVCCQKCEEDSFELVEDCEALHIDSENIKEDKPLETDHQSQDTDLGYSAKHMMATVAFGNTGSGLSKDLRKSMAATVMDASSVKVEDLISQCPKCNYPVSGEVPYCPNCGVTIRKSNSSDSVPNQVQPNDAGCSVIKCEQASLASTVMINEPVLSKSNDLAVTAKESSLKATVMDIPETLLEMNESQVYKLLSLDESGVSIELRLGSVICIEGKQYLFQK